MTDTQPPHLFCFGLGYTASYLSQYLQHEGWKISGTATTKEKCDELAEHDISAYPFKLACPLINVEHALSDVTHVLLSIPPDENGDLAHEYHAHDLSSLPNLKWVGYLSNIAVYGNQDGNWVDEITFPVPTSKRGTHRLNAEQQWTDEFNRHGLPIHIFRLSGIYGPGRSAIDTVRSGAARRIDKPGHAFNRIHVEDIVQTLIASIEAPKPGSIYNLSDGNPAPSHEVIAEACTLLGLDIPPLTPFEQTDLAPIVRSFYKDNKRIKNDKIQDELNVSLRYPDYKTGLKACLDFEKEIADLID